MGHCVGCHYEQAIGMVCVTNIFIIADSKVSMRSSHLAEKSPDHGTVNNTISSSNGISLWEGVVVLKGPSFVVVQTGSLLGAGVFGVFGHSPGSLRHGVFGQFSGEEQTDSGLDLSGGDGASPVVVSQPTGLSGDTLKYVIHEGVHDGHGLAGYTSVRVLEDLVDVDGVGFPPPPLPLVVSGMGGLCLADGLLCSNGWSLW